MEAAIKPRIGQACSLGRAHVANVALTFFYVELVKNGNWQQVEQQTPLSEGVHYVLDTARGQVTLLDDPLWQTMGHWRAADREDTLLYKGRVTAPQRIVATFDAYIPTEVVIGVDKTEVSAENLTITVEGGADVPVAIYSDGSRVGSLVVNGSHRLTRCQWLACYDSRCQCAKRQIQPTARSNGARSSLEPSAIQRPGSIRGGGRCLRYRAAIWSRAQTTRSRAGYRHQLA
jgi:hypothetical protein